MKRDPSEDIFDGNVRDLLVACDAQLDESYREFLRRLHAGEPAAERPVRRSGRLAVAASIALCLGTLWVLIRPGPSDRPGSQEIQVPAEIEALLRQLGDEDVRVRDQATDRLVGLGERGVPFVERALRHKDAEVAARAREILDRIYRPVHELGEPLQKKLREIEERIRQLRASGRDPEASELEQELRRVRSRILSGGGWADADAPELHVVGLYEAGTDPTQTPAVVNVTCTDRPVVLAICAYEAVEWRLNVAPGVRLQKVLVGGYGRQSVQGIPAGVPVVRKVYEEDKKTREYFWTHGPEHEGYVEATRNIRKVSGLEISTLLGSYSYSGQPFIVGPENLEWRRQRFTPLVDSVHERAMRERREALRAELSRVRFTAVHLTRRKLGEHDRSQVGEFSPLGPVAATLKDVDYLTTPWHTVALDAEGKKLYGLSMHYVFEMDPGGGNPKNVTPESREEGPHFSWPRGLTLDGRRKRLLMLAGGGAARSLWAYEPANSRWSVVAHLKPESPVGLACATEGDRLYALADHWGEGEGPGFKALYHLDMEGKVLDTVPLSEPVAGSGMGEGAPQLIAIAADRLVVLSGPCPNSDPAVPFVNRAYVVNPKTGEVVFSCVQKPQ